MINDETLELHKFMQARRTLFCYSGPLSEDLLTSISSPVRQQLTESESDENVAKRVFGVFVEQAQNIIRYAKLRADTGEGVGTIAISVTDDDGFLIEAVNAIDSTKRTVLKSCAKCIRIVCVAGRRKAQRELVWVSSKWRVECSGSSLKSQIRKVGRSSFIAVMSHSRISCSQSVSGAHIAF